MAGSELRERRGGNKDAKKSNNDSNKSHQSEQGATRANEKSKKSSSSANSIVVSDVQQSRTKGMSDIEYARKNGMKHAMDYTFRPKFIKRKKMFMQFVGLIQEYGGWFVAMVVVYPVFLLAAFLRALWMRYKFGDKPSAILKYGNGGSMRVRWDREKRDDKSKNKEADSKQQKLTTLTSMPASYCGQFVFGKRFQDPGKLEKLCFELCEECGVNAEVNCLVEVQDVSDFKGKSSGLEKKLDQCFGGLDANCFVDSDLEGENLMKFEARQLMWSKENLEKLEESRNQKEQHHPSFKTKMAKQHHVRLRIVNGTDREVGDDNANKKFVPTVIHFYLPAKIWDGTSCFNFMKELIARYYGDEKQNVAKLLQLKPECAQDLDANYSFGDYLNSLPVAVWNNTSAIMWAFMADRKWSLFAEDDQSETDNDAETDEKQKENSATSSSSKTKSKEDQNQKLNLNAIERQLQNTPECVMLNFNEEDSDRLYRGCKEIEYYQPLDGNPSDVYRSPSPSPFAALSYAAVSAFEKVLKRKPYCIFAQASLQTRCYEDDSQKSIEYEIDEEPKENEKNKNAEDNRTNKPQQVARNLVGDWLVQPVLKIEKRKPYFLETAHIQYEQLIRELEDQSGSVAKAFYAKAYGFLNSGAAIFGAMPTYGDSARVFDSIFFNNYGKREIHADSDFISYNWAAPILFGCNTSFVNGKTCITFASSFLDRKTLVQARDHAEIVLRSLMSNRKKKLALGDVDQDQDQEVEDDIVVDDRGVLR